MKTLIAMMASALFLALAASAEDGFQIEVNPKVYSKKAFEQQNVTVGDIPARVKRPDSLPEKKERETRFAGVSGLSEDIAQMDELDRDILFVRARTKPLKELQKNYPGIEKKKLAKLRELLQKNKPDK